MGGGREFFILGRQHALRTYTPVMFLRRNLFCHALNWLFVGLDLSSSNVRLTVPHSLSGALIVIGDEVVRKEV